MQGICRFASISRKVFIMAFKKILLPSLFALLIFAVLVYNNSSWNPEYCLELGTPNCQTVPGIADTEYYHRSWVVLRAGKNPYLHENTNSPELVGKRAAKRHYDYMRFVYPPFVMALLSPYLRFSLLVSSLLSTLINTSLLVLGLCLLLKAFGRLSQSTFLTSLFFLFLSAPAFNVVSSGNFGAILFFSISSTLYFLSRQKHFSAGVILGLSFLKPHIMVFGIAGIFFSCSQKLRLVLGASTLLIGLSLYAEFLRPGFHAMWIESLGAANKHLLVWVNSSLSGVIKIYLTKVGVSVYGLFLATYIPFLFAAFVFLYLLWKALNNKSYDRLVFYSLLMGPFFAPYAWCHDYTPALISLIYIITSKTVANIKNIGFWTVVFPLLLLQSLALAAASFDIKIDTYWWYGFGIIVVGILFLNREDESSLSFLRPAHRAADETKRQ
jgi:hypothetical protein